MIVSHVEVTFAVDKKRVSYTIDEFQQLLQSGSFKIAVLATDDDGTLMATLVRKSDLKESMILEPLSNMCPHCGKRIS